MLYKNSSFKKLTNTYKNHITKSKASGLLLTDFNKFPIVHSKAKTTKKKSNINHHNYSNNSLKIKHKKSENDINNNDLTNDFNYIYQNLEKKVGFKLINDNIKNKKGLNKQVNGNNANKDIKNIDIIDNNIPKQENESMKCNSVNNLIGINISVNYMNKNYSIKNLKHNSKKANCDNSYNNNTKINCNNNININNNSFNEINSGNLVNSSSGKNKLNKKNIFIVNPLNQDWGKIIDNIKSKKRNKSKINIDDNMKSEKYIQNLIENNNINTSIDDNNISSKTNHNIIEKSTRRKNMNYIKKHKEKKTSNKFIHLYQNMNKKINQLLKIKEGKNNDYNNILLKIIDEYFMEYNNIIEDQYQKQLISEIFHQMNNIIQSKEEQINNLKKENEEIIKLNKSLKTKNEELIKINNNSNIKEESFVDSSNSDSSSVNTEELESIRFFDKIIMKKNSFSNIPELSFKKLNKNKNEKNIAPKKNNIKKRHSFQGNNKNKEIKNNKYNIKYKEVKKNIMNKNNGNIQLLFQKRKINEKNERNKPNIKSFINIFEKSRNKK